MKVIVRNRAYVEKAGVPPRVLELFRQELIVIPRGSQDYGERLPIWCYQESEKWIALPRMYFEWTARNYLKGFDIEYQISEGQDLTEGERLFFPRPEDQIPAIDVMVKFLQKGEHAAGILGAHTGFGKSLCGLEIARLLGRNTIIIVHREPLLLQWKATFEKHFKGFTFGVVQGARIEFIGCDFVFAMLQTLMGSEKIPKQFWNYFGTVVFDETHICGAEKFGSVAPRFNCKSFLGLSGTVRRLDGCENVFKWHIGDIAHKPSEVNRLKPEVYVRYTDFYISRNYPKATLLNILAKDDARNRRIAHDLYKAIKAGRNPLVASERIEMLRNIASVLLSLQKVYSDKFTVGFYLGGQTPEERKKAEQATIIFTTMQCAKEGIDLPRMDTLAIVTPCSDQEQLCGRVTRVVPGKKIPFILDYVDLIPRCVNSFKSRYRIYDTLGWKIHGMQDMR
jgi:superfamily II DNA or RNA helicase